MENAINECYYMNAAQYVLKLLSYVICLLIFIFYIKYSKIIFDRYPRMLRVGEVWKHSDISSNVSIKPVHECLIITGRTNSCYGPCSLLFGLGI